MQPPDQAEILNRLKLIEQMMADGRRSTERWGWNFLLWGAGCLAAMFWQAALPYPNWAWPVTMALCIAINGAVLKARKRRGSVETAATRSVGAVWACVGATVLLLAFGAVAAGTTDFRLLYAALFALAAVAHGTSSVILRWGPQFATALVWWLASVLALFLPQNRLPFVAAAALVLGNLVFGAWLTYREWSRRDD